MSVQHEIGTHWESGSPGLLPELALAFPTCWGERNGRERGPTALPCPTPLAAPPLTHDDDDADGTQNPCTDEPSDSEAVPV